MKWAATPGTNAESVVDSALKMYVRDDKAAGVYLQPGTRSSPGFRTGQIVTSIVAGGCPETD